MQPPCGTPLLPPRSVFLSACERSSKALHYHELRVQLQPSCGTPLLPPRTVFLSACERRPKALHSHELRIQSQPSCGTTLLPPRCAVERTRASPQKRRTTMSWVPNGSHLAARLCCRRAVLLNARARRSKATHYHELRIRMQPSCGTLLLPPRTVFLSASERRSKTTHYHKLRIRFQPSCGTPLLPPSCAIERT